MVRSVAFGRRAYIPGDPKGEWTPVARAVGGQAVVLGQAWRPGSTRSTKAPHPPGLAEHGWAQLVWQRRRDLLGSLTETVLGRTLHPVEHTALDAALATAVAENGAPTLPGVVAHLLDPSSTDARRPP